MANDKAYFYYRSYCDTDVTGYTLTTDYENATNANDRNKLTYAITSGSGTDGDSVDYEIDMQYNRDVDTIVLKSNLKTFTIYYWDGLAYQSFTSYASNASGFLVISLTEQSTSKIKITATHTITANEEKKIYNIEVTKLIVSMYIQDLGIDKEWPKVDFNNIYGGAIQVVKYPNHGKVDINLSFSNLTGADYTAYNTLKNKRLIDAYAVYIYYSDTFTLLNSEAYYLVNDKSDYKADPSSPTMASGVSGKMRLVEA